MQKVNITIYEIIIKKNCFNAKTIRGIALETNLIKHSKSFVSQKNAEKWIKKQCQTIKKRSNIPLLQL